jgi:hypothetical protein
MYANGSRHYAWVALSQPLKKKIVRNKTTRSKRG